MNVNSSYIFQSPYNNQIQIGRPDPSTEQDKSTVDSTQKQSEDKVQEIQKLDTSKTIKNSEFNLDIYA